MSKTEVIDKLFSEISDQRTMYGWTVGIFISLILAFVAVQWYVNNRQAKKIKRETKKELLDKYILPVKSDLDDVTRNMNLYILKDEFTTALDVFGEFNDPDINDSLYMELNEYIDKMCNLSEDKAYKNGILAVLMSNVSNRIEQLKKQNSSNIKMVEKLKEEIVDQIIKHNK